MRGGKHLDVTRRHSAPHRDATASASHASRALARTKHNAKHTARAMFRAVVTRSGAFARVVRKKFNHQNHGSRRCYASWRLNDDDDDDDNDESGERRQSSRYAQSSSRAAARASPSSSSSPRQNGFTKPPPRARGRAADDDEFIDGYGDASARYDAQAREDARRRGRGDTVRYDRKAMRKELGKGPTLAESLVGEIVYGANAVREALRQNRRTSFALYVQDGDGGAGADAEVLRLAQELKIEVKYASKHDLNMLCDNKPHQGVVLDAEALDVPLLDDLPRWDGQGLPPVWLALDEIVDPQNLGAMLRSAHFLGVDGVICCAKNSAPFNATTSKASAGAMEAQVVHQTGVMHRFLAKARDEGWDVIGASAEARAEDVRDFVRVSQPTLLVMGNEGAGLRTNVRRACNRLVKIPAAQRKAPGVDSLNVSVAAGILVHHFLSSRRADSSSL